MVFNVVNTITNLVFSSTASEDILFNDIINSKKSFPGKFCFSIASLNVIFETSTIIAIIIIIVFDVISEGIIAHLRKEWEEEKVNKSPQPPKQVTQVVTQVEKHIIHEPAQSQAPSQAPAPNITINIPQQQQQPQPNQYIDRRTVQVVSPNQPLQPTQPQHNYPYFGANDLEHQRPTQNQQLPGQGYYVPLQSEPSAPRNANPSSSNS